MDIDLDQEVDIDHAQSISAHSDSPDIRSTGLEGSSPHYPDRSDPSTASKYRTNGETEGGQQSNLSTEDTHPCVHPRSASHQTSPGLLSPPLGRPLYSSSASQTGEIAPLASVSAHQWRPSFSTDEEEYGKEVPITPGHLVSTPTPRTPHSSASSRRSSHSNTPTLTPHRTGRIRTPQPILVDRGGYRHSPSARPSPYPSPYRFPLPLSSARSTMPLSPIQGEDNVPPEDELAMEDEEVKVKEEPVDPIHSVYPEPTSASTVMPDAAPSKPLGHTRHRSNVSLSGSNASGSPALGSPSGSMSMSKRRRPAPSFPDSPRQQAPPTSAPPVYHQQQGTMQGVALSPGFSPHPMYPGFPTARLRTTPVALRVPSIPQASPAFNRSGYAHPIPRRVMTPGSAPQSPHSPYLHRGHPILVPTAALQGMARTPHSASAPSAPYARPSAPTSQVGSHRSQGSGGTVKMNNVSHTWVVNSLQANAKNVWYSPETTDCRVLVPIWSTHNARKKIRIRNRLARKATEEAQQSAIVTDEEAEEILDDSPVRHSGFGGRSQSDSTHMARHPLDTARSDFSIHSNQPGPSFWPPTPVGLAQMPAPSPHVGQGLGQGRKDVVSAHQVQRGRRGSLPGSDEIPVLVFPLHKDYVITQSKLFRLLLSSTPAHLDMPIVDHKPSSEDLRRRNVLTGDPDPNTPIPNKMFKGTRLLASPADGPQNIFMPLPDPAAFGVIVHWLYW